MDHSKRRAFLKTSVLAGMGILTGSGDDWQNWFTRPASIRKLPEGAWAVMLTPYTDDLRIDYPALKRLIQWYEQTGIRGFFANCASSEMYKLSAAERIELTRFVVENSKVPVVSTGTFSTDIQENTDFIKRIYDTGVDGVVIISSVIVDQDAEEQEFEDALMQIVDQTAGIPLGLYECPSPYKRLISPEHLQRIAATGRFVYMKDTSCDALIVRQKIKACENSILRVYNAHSPDVLDTLLHRGAGTSTIASNYYPELYVYLCRHAHHQNKRREVEMVQDFIVKNDPVISRKYRLSSKYFMKLRGLPITVNSRSYEQGRSIDTDDEERLHKLWEDLQALAEAVGLELA